MKPKIRYVGKAKGQYMDTAAEAMQNSSNLKNRTRKCELA
jgi:hypothetical protein